MSIPTELIVVGMRFNPHYAKSKLTVGDTLTLVKEPTNAINKNAVAVHFPEEGTCCYAGNSIGYIRDADLNKLRGLDFDYNEFDKTSYYILKFKVNRICTNYLRITPIYVTAVNVNTFEGTNHCSEILLQKYAASQDFTLEKYAASPDFIHNSKLQYDNNLPKEKPKMINTNSMRDSFFREVSNVALDMQSGKLGVVSKDGISVFTKDGISVNPITEMGFKVPAFAMRVAVSDLKEGDIIIGSDDPTFFVEKTDTGYVTMSLSGVLQEVGNVTNMFFGKNSVLAVKNMFGNTGGADGGMNQGMMMAMMMGSDSDKAGDGFDMKKMIMMQMMMGNQGSADSQMNPMMLMMMMGK